MSPDMAQCPLEDEIGHLFRLVPLPAETALWLRLLSKVSLVPFCVIIFLPELVFDDLCSLFHVPLSHTLGTLGTILSLLGFFR